MFESPDLQPLFTQLQSRYPTSGLITELVHVHADRFVVRALVQLGNVTLATSMASAATVEQAEDEARLRVLAIVGIHPTAVPAVVGVPFSSYAAPVQPPTDPFAKQDGAIILGDAEAQHPLPTFPSFDTTTSEMQLSNRDQLPVSKAMPEAIDDGAILKTPVSTSLFEPVQEATNRFSSGLPTPLAEPYLPASGETETALETFGEFGELAVLTDVPLEAADFEEVEPFAGEPEGERGEGRGERGEERGARSEEKEMRLETLPASGEETTIAPPLAKPRKQVTEKESSASDGGTAAIASRDLSSLISQIGVEIDRIGWSKRQGSTYLQKTYGKKTRSELTDEELEDFLSYLSAQPDAAG